MKKKISLRDRFFPKSMRALPNWVLWKLETVNGRQTKVPYSALYHGKASSTNPKTWTTFENALRVYESSDEYSGIGFVFTLDSGIVFIDIDHCLNEHGEGDDRMKDILSKFEGKTFAEYSQSGTGVHIFTKGTIARGFKNDKQNVEMYSKGRFCAMTGDAICKSDITTNQNALDCVFEKYRTPERKKKGKESSSSHTVTRLNTNDQDILSKARENEKTGREFSKLFDDGDWTGFESHSNADFRLCVMLSFWCDRDFHTIDKLFRQSALCSEKWLKREDYRESTIERACECCEESYSEFIQRKSMDSSFMNEELQSVLYQIKIDDLLKKIKPDENYNTKSGDDIASGRLFAEVYRSAVRYDKKIKSFRYYDGKVWKIDDENLIAFHLTKVLYKGLYRYIGLKRSDVSKDFVSYVGKLTTRNKRETMLKESKDFLFVDSKIWDARGELLNCLNGVYNLHTHEFFDHSPEFFLTKITNVEYNPDAKSEDWEKFIEEVTQSKDKERYLQVKFGYGLTSDTSEESFDIIYGKTTRNGKSTVLETMTYILGSYAMNVNPETLIQKPRDSRSPSEDVARLNGCRFLVCPEPPKKMLFDVSRLKTFTGGDTVTARNPYEKSVEFVPCFKLFMNTNYLPVVTDNTLFSSGRVCVITFDRHFTEEEQDRTLKNRLRTPENVSGILNWCLEGLKIYQREGIVVPQCVKQATRDYSESQDKINQFIVDTLEEKTGGVLAVKDIYPKYSEWCKNNGYGVEGKKSFIEELKSKDIWKKTGTVNGKTVVNVIIGYDIAFVPLSDTVEAKETFL